MAVTEQHTLGFFAGGYKNVAKWKGIDLGAYRHLLKSPRFKSVLVGWDAADWTIAKPLQQKGVLPNLTQLMSGGIHAPIASMDPPISPMLWTSIATSRWPVDHGIHGFTEWQDGQIRAVRGTSIKVPTLWDILEWNNIPASTVAWWPSHPAQPSALGGVRVSNLALSEDENWLAGGIVPEPLQGLFAKLRVRAEELSPSVLAAFFPKMDVDSKDDVVRSVLKITVHAINTHIAATLAMDASQGGHISIYFDALDHYKHLAMKYHPPKLEGIATADFYKYQHIVEAAYRMHDLFLGKYIDDQPSANTIVLSDHGFRSGDERWIQLPDHAGAPALEHQFYGMFVASGPNVPKLKKVSGLTLLDIAPIVLALHGLQAIPEMNGRLPLQWDGHSLQEAVRVNQGAPSTVALKSPAPMLEEELLDALVKLGYLAERDVAQGGARMWENTYYLARSLRAQGRPQAAWQALQTLELSEDSPSRYILLALSLLADSKQFEELAAMLHWISGDELGQVKVYYETLVAISRGAHWSLPKRIEGTRSVELIVLWGRLLAKSDQWNALEMLLQGAEKETVELLNLKFRLHVARQQWPQAMEAGLKSTELRFHQPKIHAAMVHVFKAQNMHAESSVAQSLYAQFTQKDKSTPIFLVTGPPRSGTSLAMQLLEAAGVMAVTDGNRAADVHNAAGYFEHDAVKNWTLEESWLANQGGKALKVVFPLLRQAPLPIGPKIIIVMHRELSALLQSQRKMANAENAPLQWDEHGRWKEEYDRHERWAKMDPDAVLINLSYEEILASVAEGCIRPALTEALTELSKHCVNSVDISLLKAVVKPRLRRF